MQQQGSLSGVRVAIIVADDFEQVEMTEPRKALQDAGAETVLISPIQGQVHGMNHDVKADSFKVDMHIDQANPDDFDAVMLPGGALNADLLRMNQRARDFVRNFDSVGKPIAPICHAPWLLVSSGLVKGRRLAAYFTIQDDIRNAGGEWVDQEVVKDRNWVSSRQPSDIPAFNREMIQLFAQSKGILRKAA